MESINVLFNQIKDRILDATPSQAIFLSISKYYGKIFDYSPTNIENILQLAKMDLKNLQDF